MFLVTAHINFESYPEKLLLFCACATVQLRNASKARQELKMATQGVVTYASPVEAFATGIKMESSDQHSFWTRSRDQDEF